MGGMMNNNPSQDNLISYPSGQMPPSYQQATPDSIRNIMQALFPGQEAYDPSYDKRTPEEKAMGVHTTDRGKYPTHMTFSNESAYSIPGMEGGKWVKIGKSGKQVEDNSEGTWHFYASPFNVLMQGKGKLKDYFNTQENTSVLHLPGE
jgi:hypothetical protein